MFTADICRFQRETTMMMVMKGVQVRVLAGCAPRLSPPPFWPP